MAGGVESLLAYRAFYWLGGLLERFAAEITGRVGDWICRRALKVIFQDSSVECGDVLATCLTKFEEKSDEEVLDKPGGSHRTIMEDGPALYLNKAGAVVKMYSDCCRESIRVTERKPEDSVEFYTVVVQTWFYVRASNHRSS
jgi:hypothetical protein